MTTQPPRRSLRIRRRCSFTYLPGELQQCIGERLVSGQDMANFRLTGRAGREAVPFVGFAPVLMLPFDPESPEGGAAFYRPTDGETITVNLVALRGKVVCGSSRGWLALVDEAASVTLLNPFTGATAELPPANKHVGDACIRRVSMDVDGGRCILHSDVDPDVQRVVGLAEMREVLFRDIVLSSQPDSGDCVAVALLARSTCVAFCRLRVDGKWKLLDPHLTCRISLQHRPFSEGDDDAAETPVSSRTDLDPQLHTCVEGKLHLVGTAYQNHAYHTQVYRCDVFAHKPRWSRVKKLAGGNVTLFVSKNFLMGHAGASLAGLKNNSIYFSEPLEPRQADPNHDLEVIDIASGQPELLPYREKVCASSEAICFQPKPNPWTTQGTNL
ncbi:unnamed protein product [Alopecurus aequalis]